MADKQVAVVKPVQADDETAEQKEIVEQKTTASQESDIESESDEEIVLDEASDTENYAPPEQNTEDAEDEDDVSCSSGEEEEGVGVEEVRFGNRKLLKLKFEDVEAKRQEYLNRIKSMEEGEEDEEEEEEEEDEEEEKKQETVEAASEEDKENQKPANSFKEYRTATIMDEDLEQEYNSDADDDFDPVYCGETLSDVEYIEGEDRDTESEPETEPMDGSHKKTGEPFICIKMVEQLKIPPRGESCAAGDFPTESKDQPMECA